MVALPSSPAVLAHTSSAASRAQLRAPPPSQASTALASVGAVGAGCKSDCKSSAASVSSRSSERTTTNPSSCAELSPPGSPPSDTQSTAAAGEPPEVPPQPSESDTQGTEHILASLSQAPPQPLSRLAAAAATPMGMSAVAGSSATLAVTALPTGQGPLALPFPVAQGPLIMGPSAAASAAAAAAVAALPKLPALPALPKLPKLEADGATPAPAARSDSPGMPVGAPSMHDVVAQLPLVQGMLPFPGQGVIHMQRGALGAAALP